MDDAAVEGLMYIVRKYCERKVDELDGEIASQRTISFKDVQRRGYYLRLIGALEELGEDYDRQRGVESLDEGFLDELDWR